jgi:hypothetical protein
MLASSARTTWITRWNHDPHYARFGFLALSLLTSQLFCPRDAVPGAPGSLRLRTDCSQVGRTFSFVQGSLQPDRQDRLSNQVDGVKGQQCWF